MENATAGPDLRSFSQAEIDNWFTYHSPTQEQLLQYHEIRTAAKIFAETINRHVPGSADKTAAMRELRGVVMAANLAVACNTPAGAPTKRPNIAELESMLTNPEDSTIKINPDGSITAE